MSRKCTGVLVYTSWFLSLQLLCILSCMKKGFSCGARERLMIRRSYTKRSFCCVSMKRFGFIFFFLSLSSIVLVRFTSVLLAVSVFVESQQTVVLFLFFFALCPRLHLCYVPTGFAFGLLSPQLLFF